MLRSHPIVDREPREARLAERLKQRLDVGLLVASDEPAAMNQDARRERPGSLRHERIEREADIIDFGELDIGLESARCWLSRDNDIDSR